MDANVGWLFRYGLREDLLVELQAITTRCNGEGMVLLNVADGQDFVRAISLRNYASTIYELVHLACGVNRLRPEGALDFFWLNQSFTHSAIHSWFDESAGCDEVQFNAGEIQLTYSDGQFAIAPARVAFLAAMMEWLVGIVGFDALQQQLASLAESPGLKAVSACANTWQRDIYAYLDGKLAPQEELRHFSRLQSWLTDNNRATLGDAEALDYWLFHVNGQAKDYREYRTIAEISTAALQAMDVGNAAQKMSAAGSLGLDVESGEVHPDWVQNSLHELTEQGGQPLNTLGNPSIKFLTAKLLDQLKPLFLPPLMAERLPLTLCRDQAFGLQQSRISNALRRSDYAQVPTLCQCEGMPGYSGYLGEFEAVLESVAQARLAVLHLLITAQSLAGVAVIKQRFPDLAVWCDAQGVDSVHAFAKGFYSQLKATGLANPDLRAYLEQAQQAWAKNSRQGFKAAPQPQDDRLEYFEQADEALASVQKRITWFNGHVHTAVADLSLDSNFSSDRSIFIKSFTTLYGEHL